MVATCHLSRAGGAAAMSATGSFGFGFGKQAEQVPSCVRFFLLAGEQEWRQEEADFAGIAICRKLS